MSLFEDKHRLYADYAKELSQYSGEEMSEEEIRDGCNDLINSRSCTWKNIFDPESGELAGFLIIGKEEPFIDPSVSDRSIEEAYIRKESRGKGLMTACVKDYESRHHVRYSYHVLKGNSYAEGFWKHLFGEMGYTPYHPTEETLHPWYRTHCDFYGWQKK